MPSLPASRLSRDELARRAYTIACDRLEAALEAGSIRPIAAVAKFTRLLHAYNVRKEQLRFDAFNEYHGLQKMFAAKWSNAMHIGPKEGFNTLSQNTISYKLEAAE